MPPRTARFAPLFALSALSALSGPLAADWKDTAEFSFVATSGNSESSTLGLTNKLSREAENSLFEILAAGVRVESRTEPRFGVVDPNGSFRVVEPDPELSAENYSIDSRYERTLTPRFFWFGAGGWKRDEFAGIRNLYRVAGGVGNRWIDDGTTLFRTDYAVTWTDEEATAEDSPSNDTFVGLRASGRFAHKFSEAAAYDHVTILDENLEETGDWRVDMTNAVTVAMNSRLALRAGVQLLYDNEPAFEEIRVFDTPTRDTELGKALNELDELDTVFRTSLVVNLD